MWRVVMVFNAPFNNISAISWRSVLLVEQTGELGVSIQPAVSDWLYHIMLYRLHPVKSELQMDEYDVCFVLDEHA